MLPPTDAPLVSINVCLKSKSTPTTFRQDTTSIERFRTSHVKRLAREITPIARMGNLEVLRWWYEDLFRYRLQLHVW